MTVKPDTATAQKIADLFAAFADNDRRTGTALLSDLCETADDVTALLLVLATPVARKLRKAADNAGAILMPDIEGKPAPDVAAMRIITAVAAADPQSAHALAAIAATGPAAAETVMAVLSMAASALRTPNLSANSSAN